MRTVWLLAFILIGGCCPLMAQNPDPPRMKHPQRPIFLPSDTVHIASTQNAAGTAMWSGDGFWITQSYDLKRLMGMLCNFDPERIDVNDRELAQKRFDVAFVPPAEKPEAEMLQTIRAALERQLNLIVTVDSKPRDVFIVTAPNGPGPALRPSETMGGISATTSTFSVEKSGDIPTPGQIESILRARRAETGIAFDFLSMVGTIEDLCVMLERGLDRPVIDETNLHDNYAIDLATEAGTRTQLFDKMKTELGLLVTPAERKVSILTVRQR